jgi:hypothetical protein
MPETEVVVTEQDRAAALTAARDAIKGIVFLSLSAKSDALVAITKTFESVIARARQEAEQSGEARLRYIAASRPGIVRALQRNQWMVSTSGNDYFGDTLTDAIDAAMKAAEPAVKPTTLGEVLSPIVGIDPEPAQDGRYLDETEEEFRRRITG